MARYLVTGVAGFIGSWIAHSLVSQGHEVRGLDNMSSGTEANLSAIGGSIDFRRADIRSLHDVRDACQGIDGIFHQAAVASVQDSIERPIETNEINHVGTLNLLQAAKAHGVKRLVFASSSAVYGNQSVPVLHEQLATMPVSPYGAQKLACESALRVASWGSTVETVALRYFNVFGPRQSAASPYSGVIARFVRHVAAMTPQPEPVIYGDGEQSRDFVYIEDIVLANLRAMNAASCLVAGKAFNVGSGRAHTINGLIQHLGALSGRALAFAHLSERPGEIRSSLADIRAATAALGYFPRWSFRDALGCTLDWYRTQASGKHGHTLHQARWAHLPLESMKSMVPHSSEA
jgi:nucleoside-diphosphate-sugar epimerase